MEMCDREEERRVARITGAASAAGKRWMTCRDEVTPHMLDHTVKEGVP